MAGMEQKIGTLDGQKVVVITAPNGKVASVLDAEQAQARIDALGARASELSAMKAALTPEGCLADAQKRIDDVVARLTAGRATLDGAKLKSAQEAVLDRNIAGLQAQSTQLSALAKGLEP